LASVALHPLGRPRRFLWLSLGGGGKINTIVPLVSHTDHNKHSVQVIITEQGIADLRGKSPGEWVRLIIENCAHADYRGLLRDCAALAGSSHSPHRLGASFSLHLAFASEGDMRAARYASA